MSHKAESIPMNAYKSEITETQLKSYRRKDFPKTATVFAFGDKKKSGL
jgi:hypothetical protein